MANKFIPADQFVRDIYDVVEAQALEAKAKAQARGEDGDAAYEAEWRACFGGMQAVNNAPMVM